MSSITSDSRVFYAPPASSCRALMAAVTLAAGFAASVAQADLIIDDFTSGTFNSMLIPGYGVTSHTDPGILPMPNSLNTRVWDCTDGFDSWSVGAGFAAIDSGARVYGGPGYYLFWGGTGFSYGNAGGGLDLRGFHGLQVTGSGRASVVNLPDSQLRLTVTVATNPWSWGSWSKSFVLNGDLGNFSVDFSELPAGLSLASVHNISFNFHWSGAYGISTAVDWSTSMTYEVEDFRLLGDPIPAPGALALFGGAGLLRQRRRRR
jgi:hypothetical protein